MQEDAEFAASLQDVEMKEENYQNVFLPNEECNMPINIVQGGEGFPVEQNFRDIEGPSGMVEF